MTPEITKLVICALAIALGIFFHFISKLSELETAGVIITPWDYWRKHPYTSISVVLSAYIMLWLQFELKELSVVGSLFVGIGCNAIGDKLRARAAMYGDRVAKAGDQPVQPP